MFRLTREVRFAVNDDDDADDQLRRPPSNSYGGYPSLVGYGRFYSFAVTLAGELDPATGYLRNIKDIDDAVRRHDILVTMEPGGTYVDWRKVPKFGIREVRPHNWTIGSPANDPFTHYRALTIKMDVCLPREGQTGHNFLRPFAYLKGQFPV